MAEGCRRCSPPPRVRTLRQGMRVVAFALAFARIRALSKLSFRGFRAGGQEDAASYCLTTMNLQPCSVSLVYFANKVNAHFI